MSPLWPSSSSARILRPGHSTRTGPAGSRLDRAAFCGTIAAFSGGLHGPSTMALLTPLTRDEVAPDLVSLWDECERVYPDFRHLRSEEHTSELQSPYDLVCRLLLEKKK